jgi:hypothetical protein
LTRGNCHKYLDIAMKSFKKSFTTNGWSGLAVAATAVHSTAPWYLILVPVALVVIRLVVRYTRRGGGRGGRSGQ